MYLANHNMHVIKAAICWKNELKLLKIGGWEYLNVYA